MTVMAKGWEYFFLEISVIYFKLHRALRVSEDRVGSDFAHCSCGRLQPNKQVSQSTPVVLAS